MKKRSKKYLLLWNDKWELHNMEQGGVTVLQVPAEVSTVLAYLEKQGIRKEQIGYERPVKKKPEPKCTAFEGPVEESPLFKEVMNRPDDAT